ncbi:E3 ubiquitin-protein ligase RNF135 [Ctenodactylus gundi]
MAGPTCFPVWLDERDLGCIICHELLACPCTLPCGHNFCRQCLEKTWDAWGTQRPRACPTCFEGAAQALPLRKNTQLQELVDKYSRAARELEAGPGRAPSPAPCRVPATAAAPPVGARAAAPVSLPGCPRRLLSFSLCRCLTFTRPSHKLKTEVVAGPGGTGRAEIAAVTVQKSITEVIQELTELVGELVGITKSFPGERPVSESEPDDKRSICGPAPSSGEDLSLASATLGTSNSSEGKMRDILHNLEEIQEKLRRNFSQKEAQEERMKVEFLKAPSSSSCPLPNLNCPAPRRASRFTQWAVVPTFDVGSLACNLEVSEDCRTVTVSYCRQPYPWSKERFSSSQVLCSQAFTSGQQYWEVDTWYCDSWAVGVASWGMSRNQLLGRTKDSWCIEWKGTGQLSAWTMAKETVLKSDRPVVVGIWLDLEEGKLAFYSASQESLMYECEVPTSLSLHPAFWLYGLRCGNSLIIKHVRDRG